jgi:hypothetical protein
MKKLLLFVIPLLISCDSTPKVFRVEFNSEKVYRVKSTGYYHGHNDFIYFYGEQGMFPVDSIKSITVETYE